MNGLARAKCAAARLEHYVDTRIIILIVRAEWHKTQEHSDCRHTQLRRKADV
jgi:hypothetical protein